MTVSERKKGSKKILRFLDELKEEWWIGYGDREWWVDYLFHFTDIRNAVSILEGGYLLSRNEARRQKSGFVDAASPKVITWTENRLPILFDCVRFYFRPLNATTYIMEGFKPGRNTAHCPVPVYLLFDMREIITSKSTFFSDGNLASQESKLFSEQKDFRQLDFELIYNDRYDWQSRTYKRARQAEVIYPLKVSLDHLKYIWCRSPAEYETLRNLLPSKVWSRWKDRVKYSHPHKLFSKFWLHVEEVLLSKERIQIFFNSPLDTKYYGPFKISVEAINPQTGYAIHQEHNFLNVISEMSDNKLQISLPLRKTENYIVRVLINDSLAYLGRSGFTGSMDLSADRSSLWSDCVTFCDYVKSAYKIYRLLDEIMPPPAATRETLRPCPDRGSPR